MKMKITKNMTLKEVLENRPEVISVFVKYGLHCIGCPLAQRETVELAAKVHKVDLNNLLEDLNEAIKKIIEHIKRDHSINQIICFIEEYLAEEYLQSSPTTARKEE